MLKKTSGGWVIMSEDGSKKLSRVYKSKKEANERLRQIEYFKNKGKP